MPLQPAEVGNNIRRSTTGDREGTELRLGAERPNLLFLSHLRPLRVSAVNLFRATGAPTSP